MIIFAFLGSLSFKSGSNTISEALKQIGESFSQKGGDSADAGSDAVGEEVAQDSEKSESELAVAAEMGAAGDEKRERP